jgi:hypothetical protein
MMCLKEEEIGAWLRLQEPKDPEVLERSVKVRPTPAGRPMTESGEETAMLRKAWRGSAYHEDGRSELALIGLNSHLA